MSLSGGEVKRLAIARAVLQNPPVRLLDKAIESLDAISERDLLDRLFAWTAGRTMVWVTHRAAMLPRFTRAIGLVRGTIAASGLPGDIAGHPLVRRVGADAPLVMP
ncbi:MAG: hypothetical protein ACP5QO_01870 [Clostridia bacterium]